MERFEYQKFDSSGTLDMETINEWGKEGWRLVCALQYAAYKYCLIFARPLTEEAADV